MLPLPNRSVFRSRWKALWWAAGVCVTAVSVAGMGGHHRDGQSNDANEVTATDLGEALNSIQ
ncbi:MAG: hypothetical protein JOY99_17710 [Sphingomonadaceae bacterium]|nr:hypothetical protein [Sphingomonadaceae bacterium]